MIGAIRLEAGKVVPKYLTIGHYTAFGNLGFEGPIVASPEAVFMVLKPLAVHSLGTALIAVGFMTYEAWRSNKPESPYRFDLSELPSEIVSDAEWPVKDKKGPVIVAPRNAVKSLKLGPWWHARLAIKTADVTFRVDVGVFKRRQAREFFREHGWELKE